MISEQICDVELLQVSGRVRSQLRHTNDIVFQKVCTSTRWDWWHSNSESQTENDTSHCLLISSSPPLTPVPLTEWSGSSSGRALATKSKPKHGVTTTATDRLRDFANDNFVSNDKQLLCCRWCNIVLDHIRKSSISPDFTVDKHRKRK
ncbi:hypothetical protein PoB_002953300 [Plakobranchus ocellatus]|uniref:BED-type domain-containing protein n=1 Tax=Plakobranchus ocellatus TaxID=259542 RepID=A0AAV4A8P9_9GAST|nr:hypothetical protein PoB_002953300 [Plakobranchus ocellatus]